MSDHPATGPDSVGTGDFHPFWPVRKTDLDRTGDHTPSPVWAHAFVIVCTLGAALLVVWASFGTLDVVSLADGEVIPSSRVKRVEHLEGGIIREILVEEGDEVTVGQPLVVLEETIQGTEVGELDLRLASLAMDIARLTAESNGDSEMVLPQELAGRYPDMAAQARDLFQRRTQGLASDVSVNEQTIAQLTQDVERIQARLRNNRSTLSILNRELAISADLLKENLTTEMQHLKLRREASSITGLIEEDEAALARAESALEQGRERLSDVTNSFRQDAAEELASARLEYARLAKRLEMFEDNLTRTVITSVADGVVQTISVRNPGEVVNPGETIMLIVPSEDTLVVEAHLPIRDIGYVEQGQEAIIKLATRDAGRFGEIRGRVASVSPDTFTTEEGRTYYSVRVVTERSFFEHGPDRYNLYPGMIVLVYIRTGERTVLEYLFTPFLDSLSMGLHER